MRRAGLRHTAAFLIAVAAVVACQDIPAPEGGVLSVSRVLFPSPAVVQGDTMRDSTGAAAPLRIIAYGLNGDPLDPQPIPTFILGGTAAHLEADSFLVGDQAGAKVGIVAAVGGIQTLADSVPVILEPDTLVAADSTRHVKTWSLAGDTVINSAELNTIVRHFGATDTSAVDHVIVDYELVSAPPANSGNGASVVLMRGNVPSTRDTTSGGGRASRVARMRIAAFSDTLDSAIVVARASYRGVVLGSVQFTVVFQRIVPQ